MMKWEYTTIKFEPTTKGFFGGKGIDYSAKLNEMGQQGWELVQLISATAGGSTLGAEAVFKRPVG